MKKLKSNKGVSIIWALVVFLVVGLVSVTLFHSTMLLSKNIQHVQAGDQVEILTTSFVDVIIDEIEDRDSSLYQYINDNLNEGWSYGKDHVVSFVVNDNNVLNSMDANVCVSMYYTSSLEIESEGRLDERELFVVVDVVYKEMKASKELCFGYDEDGHSWKFVKELGS